MEKTSNLLRDALNIGAADSMHIPVINQAKLHIVQIGSYRAEKIFIGLLDLIKHLSNPEASSLEEIYVYGLCINQDSRLSEF